MSWWRYAFTSCQDGLATFHYKHHTLTLYLLHTAVLCQDYCLLNSGIPLFCAADHRKLSRLTWKFTCTWLVCKGDKIPLWWWLWVHCKVILQLSYLLRPSLLLLPSAISLLSIIYERGKPLITGLLIMYKHALRSLAYAFERSAIYTKVYWTKTIQLSVSSTSCLTQPADNNMIIIVFFLPARKPSWPTAPRASLQCYEIPHAFNRELW